ncbi:MAG: M16 family metallopeptidase [Phycisphaerae bacterium]
MLCLAIALIGLLQASEPPPRFERLESGLRVVIVEDHALPLVSVQLWYRVGSAYDPPGQPGLCSVVRAILAHRDEAALKLRAAGVRFEGRTERDACYFSSVLPPNFLEYVLDVEAARMRPLTATAEMAGRGLNAAARDYAVVADDPNHIVLRHVLAAMFPDHPYQHPPGFVAAPLKDLSADEVNEFLGRWFVPGNATLFVIGDVSTVRVLEQVRQRFGKLKWAEPPRRAEPKRLEAETIQISLPHPNRAGVMIAWRTLPLGYFENAAIDVLMHHLCNEVDGPLRQRLAKEGGDFSLAWRRDAWHEHGLLMVSVDYWNEYARQPPDPIPDVSVGSAFAEQILSMVDRELQESATRTPTEIQHNRARALAERTVGENRAALRGRAANLAEHELVGGDLLLAEFGAARLRGVGVGDVQAAAELLSGARRIVATFRPSAMPSSSDGGPLISPLPANSARQLGGVAVLALLARHNRAPQPTDPKTTPPIVAERVRDGLTVSTCVMPKVQRPAVLTMKSIDQHPHSDLHFRVGSWLNTDAGIVQQALDYTGYHGITLCLAESIGRCATSSGYLGCASATRVPAIIEWQSRLVQPPPEKEEPLHRLADHVDVYVVGAVDPASIRRVVSECWQDWRPQTWAEAPTNGAEPGANVDKPGVPAAGAGRLFLAFARGERPHVELELLVRFDLGAEEITFSRLELENLARLIGWTGTDDIHIDDCRTACWRDWQIDDRALKARAYVDPEELAPTLRAMVRQIARLRNGTLAASSVATALRLGRVQHLVALDSPQAICEALWLGRENPWTPDSRLIPERFLAKMGPASRGAHVWVTARSADEELLERFSNLEHELNEMLAVRAP